MDRDAPDLLKEALKLSRKARAALASSLIDSLDDVEDEDAEAAWQDEIARRLEELDAGTTKSVPWSEVRRQILGR